jgi:hypothetical protein
MGKQVKDPELKAALLGQKAEQSAGKGMASQPRPPEVSGWAHSYLRRWEGPHC